MKLSLAQPGVGQHDGQHANVQWQHLRSQPIVLQPNLQHEMAQHVGHGSLHGWRTRHLRCNARHESVASTALAAHAFASAERTAPMATAATAATAMDGGGWWRGRSELEHAWHARLGKGELERLADIGDLAARIVLRKTQRRLLANSADGQREEAWALDRALRPEKADDNVSSTAMGCNRVACSECKLAAGVHGSGPPTLPARRGTAMPRLTLRKPGHRAHGGQTQHAPRMPHSSYG